MKGTVGVPFSKWRGVSRDVKVLVIEKLNTALPHLDFTHHARKKKGYDLDVLLPDTHLSRDSCKCGETLSQSSTRVPDIEWDSAMRRVDIIDSRTKAVKMTVTCVDGVVSIEGIGARRQAMEEGILFRGRRVMPSDGDLFLDVVLDRYSRTSYVFAVESREDVP